MFYCHISLALRANFLKKVLMWKIFSTFKNHNLFFTVNDKTRQIIFFTKIIFVFVLLVQKPSVSQLEAS